MVRNFDRGSGKVEAFFQIFRNAIKRSGIRARHVLLNIKSLFANALILYVRGVTPIILAMPTDKDLNASLKRSMRIFGKDLN